MAEMDPKMNIYLVERTDDGGGYDTFSDFVCLAESEEEARKIHPENQWGYGQTIVDDHDEIAGTWVKYSETKATLVGTVSEDYETPKHKIICASFHAG